MPSCPDCLAQLPAETTLEAHRAATKRATERADLAVRNLRAANRALQNAQDHGTRERARLAVAAAEKLVAQTAAAGDAARKCTGDRRDDRRDGREGWGGRPAAATAGARAQQDERATDPLGGEGHDEID